MMIHTRLTSLVMVLAGATLMAQETTGTVAGRVTSRSGQALPGALVRIKSPNLLGERTAVADANGAFRIPLLPNGVYTMTATSKDYMPSKGEFRILAGQVSRADAVLTLEKDVMKIQGEVVEVTANMTQADKTETVTQANFAMEKLDTMFSSGLTAAMQLTPGAAGDNWGLKVRGGTKQSAKFTLNGVMINDQAWGYDLQDTTIPDMIDSVAVILSPLNARFGNTDGGIVAYTTTKGSNTFKGSLRAKYGRAGWGANATPYPDRDGVTRGTFFPGDDASSRSYDVVLSGPIWKDHITFSWGGTYSPAQYWTDAFARLVPEDAASLTDPMSNQNGTFFRDPATGKVFRNANLHQQGQQVPNYSKSTYNQFVLYWQISANHQLEWNYTQNENRSLWYGYDPIDTANGGLDGVTTRVWNLGYKANLEHGVLEARFGKTMRWWPHPSTPGRAPIYLKYGYTTVPDADGAYNSNSLLDVAENGYGQYATNGATSDRGDTFFDTTAQLNYTHILDFHGTHSIDVGYEKQKFQWDTQTLSQMPERTFYAPGQLASDAGAGFANRYIVFNYNATVADLDPSRSDGSLRVYDNPTFRAMIPALRMFQGVENGTYWQPTDSFYLNDLWTLNANHSVMVGLRHDRMKVQDNRGTIFQYTTTTPRFEYKWDIFGDQSRMVNVSYGQFHNRVPGGQFQQFVNRRLAYDTTRYWTGTAAGANPNAPYLVDQAAILDTNNYKYIGAASGPGTFQLDPNWKAPISTQYEVGFRRTYQDGGMWRVTLVLKTWKNLYDSFPDLKGTQLSNPYEPSAPSLPTFVRTMRNDPDSSRSYKSVEFEWSQPYGQRFLLAGNYTYSRLMTNAAGVNDAPGGDRTPSGNFREYLVTLVPRSVYNPEILQDPEHRFKLWATYDLSTAKVKSSVAFILNYTSGTSASRFIAYNIPRPILPGYYDPANGFTNSGGLPSTISIPQGGRGQFTTNDTWATSLKYNLEVDLVRSLRWFTGIELKNPFNHRMEGDYTAMGGNARRDNLAGPSRYTAYGYRGQDSQRNAGWYNVYGARSITFETGLRF